MASGCQSAGRAEPASSANSPAPSVTLPVVTTASVPFTAARIWEVLPRAYEDVGMKPTIINPDARAVGFTGDLKRRLNGVRLSTYVKCGDSMYNNANTYVISIVIERRILAAIRKLAAA